jgi:hypothetical protein
MPLCLSKAPLSWRDPAVSTELVASFQECTHGSPWPSWRGSATEVMLADALVLRHLLHINMISTRKPGQSITCLSLPRRDQAAELRL